MPKFLPASDREYLDSKGYVYEEVEDGPQKGLIIRKFAIPEGRFDASLADVLIILPNGYPDAAPDMFHTNPWLKLTSPNVYPNRADQPVSFGGISWQRWSRHNADWRAGIDGMPTMLARVSHALTVAAP